MSTKAIVLIVDDEERNRDLMEAMLRPMGFTLVTAENGQEALLRTTELKPDLVLLDVMMPDLSGFEVRTIPRRYRSSWSRPWMTVNPASRGSRQARMIFSPSPSIDWNSRHVSRPLRS
ncbi:MAG: hypothetical protein CMO80_21545 [Verrucomicrobiales bacterium]|nr:hypothetical protein [Verrucomicrobiales bacterium]|tara:strand:- start:9838 stop:10191 length:354 start_codon:yes stop_codon:yes gene_type:complete